MQLGFGTRRAATAVVALTAWSGLAVQLIASLYQASSLFAAVWAMLFYFTVLTNLAVALLFSLLVFDRPIGTHAIGGVTLAILLVGIVYHLLLRGLLHLSGGAAVADFLLHSATPIFVLLWWLIFAPKGALSGRDPLLWAIFPLLYFGYGLIRGGARGRYPYPFMDLAALGWPRTLLNALCIAVGFLLAGYAMVAIDRRLSRRNSSRPDNR